MRAEVRFDQDGCHEFKHHGRTPPPPSAPWGRMALSNYIGATLLILAVKAVEPGLSRFDDHDGYLAGILICAAIMVIQIIVSALWLRFVGQGPLEKLWRLVTGGREGARA
ncbi:DUF418 domain-containing protein [Brevibacterium sp. FME17]|nr:DUF418 domain-containing protein [Brevibacterium sp. FME17]